MAEHLPPCNLDRACCKCGSKDINTRWVKAAPFADSVVSSNARERLIGDRLAAGEHMARRCRVCQYAWAEAPLDLCSAIDQLAAKAND